MAMKTTAAVGLRRSLRRCYKTQILSTLKIRKAKSATMLAAAKKAKNERRQATEKQQQQKLKQENAGVSGCSAASPASTTSTCEQPQTPTVDTHAQTHSPRQASNTDGQHYIFGHYFDEDDRSAADILATLYYSGVLDGRPPVPSCPGIRDASGSPPLSPRAALAISGDSVKVCDVALPSMRQTSIMLQSWHSESQKTRGISMVDITHDDDTDDVGGMDVDPDMEGETDSTYPSTPELSSGGSSVRSSFSTEPASGHWNPGFRASDASKTSKTPFPMSPNSLVSRGVSPTSLPPPAYTAAELNAASEQKTAPTFSAATASPNSGQQQQPFSTYEQSYFSSSETRSSTADRGMPSPPQSPTNSGRRTEYCFRTGHVTSPPPTYAAAIQQHQLQKTAPTSEQTSVQQPPFQQYQFQRYQQQQQLHLLPSPYNAFAASTSTSTLRPNDNIATTVVTLPPAGLPRGPLTPISPLAGPSSHYNQHNHQSLPTAATFMAPTMGATPGADSSKKERQLSRTGGPSGRKSGDTSVPRPHCNVKYETAELDFIMYQRCTKNRAWDDVTASFNAALPRLRQYAEMDYLRMSGANGGMGSPLGTPDAKAVMDRYRPRPERTTPGLQASYYRQRLALPLLDEDGRLVFDKQTGKQIFTEVMVRDDKSRKKMRRLNSGAGMAGSSAGSSNSSVSTPFAAGKDDARVHLVLYFPERVAHYDYWFVTAEDKALARQRAYDRNMQRTQRGLSTWHPGSDDPETGILIRNKE